MSEPIAISGIPDSFSLYCSRTQ